MPLPWFLAISCPLGQFLSIHLPNSCQTYLSKMQIRSYNFAGQNHAIAPYQFHEKAQTSLHDTQGWVLSPLRMPFTPSSILLPCQLGKSSLFSQAYFESCLSDHTVVCAPLQCWLHSYCSLYWTVYFWALATCTRQGLPVKPRHLIYLAEDWGRAHQTRNRPWLDAKSCPRYGVWGSWPYYFWHHYQVFGRPDCGPRMCEPPDDFVEFII